MIFESMWPLFFLAAIPIIIILYLLKPRGKDQKISSNLLWQQLLRNQESKTFFEKFVHNILMYVQILILALLVVAFMSPFVRVDGEGGGRVTLLIDTSGSMQHKGAGGHTRLEEAVDAACDYVRSLGDTRFCVVTHDDCGTKLLAVDVADRDAVVKILKGVACSDAGGELFDAQGLLSTLSENAEEGETSSLVVFSDKNSGIWDAPFAGFADISFQTVGETVSNVSNDYLAFTKRGEAYDVILSVTNHADTSVTLDVALYEDEDKLLSMRQLTLDAGKNASCLFEGVDWQGNSFKSVLSGFSFEDGSRDSLETDNVSYAVRDRGKKANALLVGAGNTYVEKAYRAATGLSIAKAENDGPALVEDYDLVIYDKGEEPSSDYTGGRMLIAPKEGVTEEFSNVMLNVDTGDLTAGLSEFLIGVNKAYCYELPEGAIPFLEYEGKCIGYYGEQNGYREVVLGFDIRESDFPLRAEFPVFMINTLTYLADSSWLGNSVYYAGETLFIKPWAEIDRSVIEPVLAVAGLYSVGNEEYREYYVVRPAISTESDGHVERGDDTLVSQVSRQKTRRTLRNLFLLLALALLVAEWFLYVKQMRYRGKFYLAVRLVVMACLVLALFGVKVSLGSNRNATIFVADLSNSNKEHAEEMTEYLKDVISKMPRESQYGIVTFGGDTMVEQFLTKEHFYTGLMTLPDKGATNIEEAVSRALTMIPSDASGRVVLLTDGRQTRGDIRNMTSALSASGAELLSIVYEKESRPDVYVEDVQIPTYLHPGDVYSITVQVESNYDTDARIQLLSGSSAVSASDVHLNKGSNRFVFKQQVTDENMERLQVQVTAPGDTCEENDTYSVCSVVEAAPKVLVISGAGTDTSQFASVLAAAGCDYSVRSAFNAPKTINEMLEYRSLLLVNTYIDDLPNGFVKNIESYVRDYGGGFVCCGGEESFALGGYRNSALETVLPVDMELRNENEIPSMAIVMVIDRSGSMQDSGHGGGSKLDLAIRAATVAVDNLRESDYVGVLTFDDRFFWQVELTQADNKEAIKKKIEDLPAGGGTTIKPALMEAGREISRCDTTVKHVVLLTDGMGETTDFQDAVKEYTGAGVTLSTVAVGDDSDTKLLKKLADLCGGRYYFSNRAKDIPKIFAQEVFLGSDSFIRNGDFALAVRTSHELTRGLFAEGWPGVYGYVASTPKRGSQMIMADAEKEDPILTIWQYGLGHTAAWNTDVTNEWSAPFAGKEDYIQLWKRIVDYSTGNVGLGEDSANVVSAGGYTEIVYTTENYDGQTAVTANYVDPDGETGEVLLHATAPGHYEAEFATPKTGIYNLQIRRSDDDSVTNILNTAAAIQFADEYKFDIGNAVFLDFLEKYGERITAEDNIWSRKVSAARGKYPLTNWLMALGIALFLVDVAMRRFQYEPNLRWKRGKVGRTVSGNTQTLPQGHDMTSVSQQGRQTSSSGQGISGQGGRTQAGQQTSSTGQNMSGQGGRTQTGQQTSSPGLGMSGQGSFGVGNTDYNANDVQTASKGDKKKEKKRKKEEETQILDTSQLLRKKDERNL